MKSEPLDAQADPRESENLGHPRPDVSPSQRGGNGDHSTELRVETDLDKIDLDFVVREIGLTSWASQRTKAIILKSLEHSLNFGLFRGPRQIGFARVISDRSTYAYLCDVLITETERGQGCGQSLLTAVFAHPELASSMWTLRTRTAHTLYEKFGFVRLPNPEYGMQRAAVNKLSR